MKTLYKAKWILAGNRVVLENAGFIVENGEIKEVLEEQGLSAINPEKFKTVDFGNSVITPGFINLHTHLQYTLIGKKRSGNPLNRIKKLFLIARKFLTHGIKKNSFVSWIINLLIEYFCLSEKEKQDSFKEGLKQVLSSGSTCIVQLSFEEVYFEMLLESPVRSYIFLEFFADSAKTSKEQFEIFREKYERLSKKCSDSIFLGISPHSLYNVHKDFWHKISEYCFKKNILIHTHFAESKEEMQWLKTGCSDINRLHDFIGCKQLKPYKENLSAIEYLKSLNLPFQNLILAHINQLNTGDYSKLKETGASIAHCPRSNLFLHNRTINIKEALKVFKDKIGLGTDSLYSNYDLNILNEAGYILKNGIEPLDILDMLTINPAKILKISHLTGSIEKNKKADFLVFYLENNEKNIDFIRKNKPDLIYISGTLINPDKLFSYINI